MSSRKWWIMTTMRHAPRATYGPSWCASRSSHAQDEQNGSGAALRAPIRATGTALNRYPAARLGTPQVGKPRAGSGVAGRARDLQFPVDRGRQHGRFVSGTAPPAARAGRSRPVQAGIAPSSRPAPRPSRSASLARWGCRGFLCPRLGKSRKKPNSFNRLQNR